MATIIKIKRTTGATAPSGLEQGELAYVYDTSQTNNGVGGNGYRLFIGDPTSTSNSAIEIGGEYFTNLLDHSHGVVTANSSVIVDGNKKVDEWNVDNLKLDGNAFTSTNTDGDITITPNGTGKSIISNIYTDATTSLQEYIEDISGGQIQAGEGIDVVYDDGAGTTTISGEDASDTNKGIASFVAADFDVSSGAVSLEDTVVKTVTTDSGAMTPTSHSFSVLGGEGMDVTHTGTTITVAGEDATSSNKGIASFDSTDFTVTSGAVAVNAITLGSSSLNPGATTTDIAGLTSLVVDNVSVDGSTITATSGDLTLTATSGNIDANSNKIVNVATPVNDTDAANKAYVDAARTGLDVKGSVKVATTANITLSGTQTIDGVALSVGDRVLVKNQTTASENGIYVVASSGWSRATDADENAEVTSGMFTFVEQGSVNSDTGFVLTTDGTITVGSTNLEFTLFSASGTLIAGDGLSKNGDTLEVNVANGLQIASDNVELASSVAGDGLTFSSGVIDVVGTTNRIDVSANAIDISTSYIGQTSITTLGTITAGTWQGDVIGTIYGGTGLNSYTTGDILYASASNTLAALSLGTSGKILQSDGTNVTYGDIDGGTY